jgi:phosphoenolpyruvate-protein phosphotransferase
MIGLGIAPGLGMGTARVMCDVFDRSGRVRRIHADDIEGELARLRTAFEQTRLELKESARRIEEQFDAHLADVFRAHEMMLESLLSSDEFAQELRGSLLGAETAVRRVFQRWQEKFQSLNNETLQQRADDIVDIGRKVLRHLEPGDAQSVQTLSASTVLVVERLLPSDVVSLSPRTIAAIVVESLGYGSHAALLAREKSIPTVADLPGLLDLVHDGDEVLVDAARGEVVIAPNAAQRAEFEARLKTHESSLARCRGTCQQPALTLDGEQVTVEANLGAYDDAQLARDNGADGVGLLRTEQLYLAREQPPTEDELLDALRNVTAPLRDKPLTIRLLDIGGDKAVPFLRLPAVANPLLGRRGVRLLLDYPRLAQTQLAALLRLAQEQDIRVLVPMVTLDDDIRAMRELFEQMCAARRVHQRPLFGAMIETPAAALCVPAIAKYVDFLSVGTNDLTQYTLAVGRDDPAVNRYFLDNHASLLRLLGIIVHDAGPMPLTLCGELAGREEMIPELLAMGFRSLSVSPPLIPAAKQRVRSLRVGSAMG